jgi:hypothetical protein
MADTLSKNCSSCLSLDVKKLTDQINITSATAQSWEKPYTRWLNPAVKTIQQTAAQGCACCSIILEAVSRFGLVDEVKACRANRLQAWNGPDNAVAVGPDNVSPVKAPLTERRFRPSNIYDKVPQQGEEGYNEYYGGLTAVVSLEHRVYKEPFSTVLPRFGLEFDGQNLFKALTFELYTLPGMSFICLGIAHIF